MVIRNSNDLEKQVEDTGSESGSSKDSVSSHGDFVVNADKKMLNRTSNKHGDEDDISNRSSRVSAAKNNHIKATKSGERIIVKSVPKSNRKPSTVSAKGYIGNVVEEKNSLSKTSFESSEGMETMQFDDVKEISKMDQVSGGTRSVESDESDEEDTHNVAVSEFERSENSESLIKEMDSKIEKLEEELREVAALEISIYFVKTTVTLLTYLVMHNFGDAMEPPLC